MKKEKSISIDFSFFDLFCLLGLEFYKCLCKLIGAGRGLEATTDSRKTFYGFVDVHSFDKACYALRITSTATCEFNLDYSVAVDFNINGA